MKAELVFVACVMLLQTAAAAAFFYRGQWRLGLVWVSYVVINWAITPWGSK